MTGAALAGLLLLAAQAYGQAAPGQPADAVPAAPAVQEPAAAPEPQGEPIQGVTLTLQQRGQFARLLAERTRLLERFDQTNAALAQRLQATLAQTQDPAKRAAVEGSLREIEAQRDALQINLDGKIVQQVLTTSQINTRNRHHLAGRVNDSLGPIALSNDQGVRLGRALDAAVRAAAGSIVLRQDIHRGLEDEILLRVLTPDQRGVLLEQRRQQRLILAGVAGRAAVHGGGGGELVHRGGGTELVHGGGGAELVHRGGGRDDRGGLFGFDDDALFDDNLIGGGLHNHRQRGRDTLRSVFFDDRLFPNERLFDDGPGGRRGRGSDDSGRSGAGGFDDSGGRGGRGGSDDSGGRGGSSGSGSSGSSGRGGSGGSSGSSGSSGSGGSGGSGGK